MLKSKRIISESIYEIRDIGELEVIRSILYSDVEFVALDTRGNRMYSAGMNNYYRFASGEEMFGKSEVLPQLDSQLPVGEKIIVTHEEWKRSSIIKTQTLESSGYLCEIDPSHTTFIAKSNGKQYMEGHHAIPMKYQDYFSNSIDIYANVICLCPVCHRLIHYGEDESKRKLLSLIYTNRGDRLATSGIKIAKDDFERLAIG